MAGNAYFLYREWCILIVNPLICTRFSVGFRYSVKILNQEYYKKYFKINCKIIRNWVETLRYLQFICYVFYYRTNKIVFPSGAT